MPELKLDSNGEQALHGLQNTVLSPLEENLYRAWAKANQIENPEDPNQEVDLRGMYQATNGKILPFNQLNNMINSMQMQNKLEESMYNQMQKRIAERTKEFVGANEQNATATNAGKSPSKPK
jgi:hypothetical protein